MREQGLRQVQVWVPDTTRPGFAEDARAWVDSLKGKTSEDSLDEAMEAEMALIEGWSWKEDR